MRWLDDLVNRYPYHAFGIMLMAVVGAVLCASSCGYTKAVLWLSLEQAKDYPW